MKTIFLDFDGVLHPMSATKEEQFGKLTLLDDLVEKENFYVVISSSWRFHYPIEELKSRLGRVGKHVVGATGLPVVGQFARYREITAYCEANHVTDWRALDDAFFEFPKGLTELILCKPSTGLCAGQIEELRCWLNPNLRQISRT